MDECVGGLDGWVGGRMDKWMNRQRMGTNDKCMDEWEDSWKEGQMNGKMEEWIDKQMDKLTNGWMDERMDLANLPNSKRSVNAP